MVGKFLGCVPWPSEARPSARECGETETETETETVETGDCMRWVRMIAQRAGAVRHDEFSVPASSVVCLKGYTGPVAASHSEVSLYTLRWNV